MVLGNRKIPCHTLPRLVEPRIKNSSSRVPWITELDRGVMSCSGCASVGRRTRGGAIRGRWAWLRSAMAAAARERRVEQLLAELDELAQPLCGEQLSRSAPDGAEAAVAKPVDVLVEKGRTALTQV